MKINLSIDPELLAKVDAQAKKLFVSRSAYIAFAVSQKLQADNLLENVPEMVNAMNRAIELGEQQKKAQNSEKPSEGVSLLT